MLVAPVASNQAISRVYLPEGADWYRFSSGKKYAGGRAWDVPSPLDDLPVFVKAGAIIPMQSVTQSTAAKGDGILYLHVWYGGKQDSLLYYEDDGRSYAYEKGADYRRLIRFRPGDRSLVLGKVAGSYPSRFKEIRLVLHGFPVLSGLRLDGAAVAVGPPDKGSGVQRCTIRNGSGLLKISWQ
jgi:alpha-glucosidase